METQDIIISQDGQQLIGQVQLLCPSALIFVVSVPGMEPFHLEYNNGEWEAIEEGIPSTLTNSLGEQLVKTHRNLLCRSIEPEEEYFIVENEGVEMICSWTNDLRIRVSACTEALILGDISERVYFGSYQDEFRAFQTIDYSGEDSGLVKDAIAWYTNRSTKPLNEAAKQSYTVSLN